MAHKDLSDEWRGTIERVMWAILLGLHKDGQSLALAREAWINAFDKAAEERRQGMSEQGEIVEWQNPDGTIERVDTAKFYFSNCAVDNGIYYNLNQPEPTLTRCVNIVLEGNTLLTISPDGTVTAPSLEAASEAGRVFVESIRHYLRLEATDAPHKA